MKNTNYSKLDYKWRSHLQRYQQYVNRCGLICQECGGSGEYVNDRIDFGDGSWPIIFNIYEPCGWCEGTGKVTRRKRGEWLRYRKEVKSNIQSLVGLKITPR